MTKFSNQNIHFLKRLYISYITDNFTLNALEKMVDQKVMHSEFFSFMKFNFDRLNCIDFVLCTESEYLETKDNPSFELQYKIFKFYSGLSTLEKQSLYEYYCGQLLANEPSIPTIFDINENKIPSYLLNYLFDNSLSFFDEFDVSDGFIEIEDLLMTSEVYLSRLHVKKIEYYQ